MSRIEEIRARLVEIADSIHAIYETADAQRRSATAEEVQTIENMTSEFDALEAELKRREKADEISARVAKPQERVSEPRQPSGLQNTVLRSREERDRWGFQNLGEYAKAVLAWQQNKGQDPRLISNAALSTYSSEGVGADGGFAVPPEFRTQIQSLVMAEESIFGRCDTSPTTSNLVIVPTDEDTVWGTSGGVRVYRRGEAGTMTQSKAALKEITVRVEELYALVPVTDQLLEDAPMMSRQLSLKVGQKMNFAITNEIINGTGAGGQMLGILNAPCLVTVSKETSQPAATIFVENIDKMWTRMPAAVRGNAVWLANQDCEVALENMSRKVKNVAGTENVGGWPVYTPPGGISDRPYGTIKGRPVIFTEACSTLGTVGDIVLAYLPGYFVPYKAGGMREAMSMHLWFDQGVTAMRWTFRLGGQPWLSAPLARRSGSNTFSHFVALETRS